MLFLVRMQFNNHEDKQPVKRFERAMRCICDIKFGMLQVRKNEISLRKSSGGSADLRSCTPWLRGNTSTRESAQFDYIYLFVYSRHEVHSMNTHTLQNAG